MELISENEFAKQMREIVEPCLARFCQKGKFANGLYYETYFPADMKAVVVISHGFTESCLKFHEVIYYLLEAGYGAAALDHRGHGYSARDVAEPGTVHIDSFDRYVEDLYAFVTDVVLPGANGVPLCLYGHSMGGCAAVRLLETHPGLFCRAVLNAPMLGLVAGPVPPSVGLFVCRVMEFFGQGKKKLFFQKNFDPDSRFEDDVATSRARFDYYQALRREQTALQTSAASYTWAKEAILAGRAAVRDAGKVQIPVLLFQAETDTLVSSDAEEQFVRTAPNAELVRVAHSKHEIYRSENEVLEGYWEKILRFLAPAASGSGAAGDKG